MTRMAPTTVSQSVGSSTSDVLLLTSGGEPRVLYGQVWRSHRMIIVSEGAVYGVDAVVNMDMSGVMYGAVVVGIEDVSQEIS